MRAVFVGGEVRHASEFFGLQLDFHLAAREAADVVVEDGRGGQRIMEGHQIGMFEPDRCKILYRLKQRVRKACFDFGGLHLHLHRYI